MTTRKLRLFIAVELPAPVRGLVEQVLGDLSRRVPVGVRWVRPEGVHLTLKFLGETPEEQMEAIGDALTLVAGSIPPFCLEVRGAGAFPNMRSPRVAWLGLDGETGALARVQGRLEDALVDLGFPAEERDFSPHLTLGRVNGRLSTPQLSALARGLEEVGARAFPAFLVEAMSLIESQLSSTGATYYPRRRARVGEG
ncbi:MAG: RNA 2',3'-cyclic phosphodiesterase [Chloroflexi bacterium]|nr:RNA 2',3'-cyclic phosphodiesterase [Chloroflexota bacterium]